MKRIFVLVLILFMLLTSNGATAQVNTTKEFFVPISTGRNIDRGDVLDVVSIHSFPSVALDDADDKAAVASFVMPADYISGQPVSATAYISLFNLAQDCDLWINQTSFRWRVDDILRVVGTTGFLAHPVITNDFGKMKQFMTITLDAVPLESGDPIGLRLRRDADNVSDTCIDSVLYVHGFLVQYSGLE